MFNVHIYPQSYLFDMWTLNGLLDIEVSVFHVDDMDSILSALMGQAESQTKEHARESNADGKQDKIGLEELSAETISSICNAYAMDLHLMAKFGMHDPHCAP